MQPAIFSYLTPGIDKLRHVARSQTARQVRDPRVESSSPLIGGEL